MGGNGTIGGGRSANLAFTVKERQKGKTKQKWEGTDPYVESGNQTSSIRVTFLTPFVKKGADVYEGDLEDGDCVKIEWYPNDDPPSSKRKGSKKPKKKRR